MAEKAQSGAIILRRKELEAKIGLCCSTIYNRMDQKSPGFDPAFPRPVALGIGKNPPVGWLLSEVESWLLAQIETSRKVA